MLKLRTVFQEYTKKQTKNSVEEWHNNWHNNYCFTSILSAKRSSIWRFMDALKKEETINQLKTE